LDEFRTQNWSQIKEEVGAFVVARKMNIQKVNG
jgi:uncharacterized protein YfaT (DUF1175 family)